MKIVKRNGSEVTFDVNKIVAAIERANITEPGEQRLTHQQVVDAADVVEAEAQACGHTVTVEEVQDMVEDQIMAKGAFSVARNYITYRYIQGLKRQSNTTDDKILSLIECNNEEVKQENSNKNPTVNSVQRDYMAGEVSKDLTMRMLLPEDVVEAHNEGIIHFHDSDYYAQHMHNCDLVNLDDMLQNGTVISGTLIEKPHSFSTACNIATQIIAQVASSQYGGQSISLTHLAPFVEVSRQKIRREVTREIEDRIVESLRPDYIKGLSLLGGDPMEPENQRVLAELVERVTRDLPAKDIWCYTGYVYDRDLVPGGRKWLEGVTNRLLDGVDVLVDGPFVEAKKDITLRFRGSSNQRLIDLAATRATAGKPGAPAGGTIIFWDDGPIFSTRAMD